MSTSKPVAVKLDEYTRERLQRLSEVRERAPHWILKQAIGEYLDREEKREAFRAAALQAWEEYALTGRHVTHASADAWLEQLESGTHASPPECQR